MNKPASKIVGLFLVVVGYSMTVFAKDALELFHVPDYMIKEYAYDARYIFCIVTMIIALASISAYRLNVFGALVASAISIAVWSGLIILHGALIHDHSSPPPREVQELIKAEAGDFALWFYVIPYFAMWLAAFWIIKAMRCQAARVSDLT